MADNRISTKLIAFIMISALVIAIVAYLGSQTIGYQALRQQYAMEAKGKVELSRVVDVIESVLQIEEGKLRQGDESAVQQIFILEGNQLIYPNIAESLSMKEQAFVQKIAPIVENSSVLYQAYLNEGTAIPEDGWYIRHDQDLPLWIFWMQSGSQITGYSVSYSYLMSQILNQLADESYDPASLITLEDNGQLLFQNHDQNDATIRYTTQQLTFPFNYWQLNYYAVPYNGWLIYTLGTIVIIVLCLVLGWLFWRVYQEYQRIQNTARQQVNFVSQVSHELKTPLTNISLFAELLQEEPLNESSQKYSEIIHSESKRLTRLIQNILSFTKKREPMLSHFDLVDLVKQIAVTFQPSYESKNLALNLQLPEACPIYSDQDAITQIINNLLSNAEKYGAIGKVVDLVIEQNEHDILVKVRDYGEGISQKHLSQIFKPFYRVHSKITEGVAGTGIGLTIAHQLAGSIHCTISAHSQEQGIEFRLFIGQR
ncbi:MAG: sensor histidine kinase [Wohlfahrtiimonas sp.]